MTEPHVLRAPVVITRTGSTVTGVQQVGLDEPVFAGHYPGFPVLPGVGVVECVQRTAWETLPEPGLALTAVDSARFLGPVRPGSELTAELTWSADGPMWTCKAEARADGARVATVRLRYSPDPPDAASADPAEPGANLSQDEITDLIPHRPPLLLLDEVTGLVPGERLVATHRRAAWSVALRVESWCQAAGVLTVHGAGPDPRRVLLLVALKGVDLVGPVPGGATVEHRIRCDRADLGAAVLSGQSCVDGRVVMRVRRMVVAVRPAAELAEAG